MGESKKRKRHRNKRGGKEEQPVLPSPCAKRTKLKEPSSFLQKARIPKNPTIHIFIKFYFILFYFKV